MNLSARFKDKTDFYMEVHNIVAHQSAKNII